MIKIAIKNPAPLGASLDKWGDYHFGLALAKALTACGGQVVQHFWPEWDKDDGEDVIIVLRGKRSYVPPTNKLSLMWIISHPATVLAEEMQRYSCIYVASETHYNQIRNDPRIHVDVARQCTDTTIFNDGNVDDTRRGISFVANSRGVRRDILTWAVNCGVQVSVVGRHWKTLGLQSLVKRDYVLNDELPHFYRSTRLTLNDHWGDMKHYGYINNRIFDCLACGTPIITDSFPELNSVGGPKLLYANDTSSFWESVKTYYLRYPDVVGNVVRLWDEIGSRYSFMARAEQIMDWASSQRWNRRPSVTGPLRLKSSPFQAMSREVVAFLRERGVKRELRMLHIFPRVENVAELFHNSDFSYLSGGFGSGPWHIYFDQNLSCIADNDFDLFIIDDIDVVKRMSVDHARQFFEKLKTKLNKTGIIATSADISSLDDQDMSVIELSNRYVIFDQRMRAA